MVNMELNSTQLQEHEPLREIPGRFLAPNRRNTNLMAIQICPHEKASIFAINRPERNLKKRFSPQVIVACTLSFLSINFFLLKSFVKVFFRGIRCPVTALELYTTFPPSSKSTVF